MLLCKGLEKHCNQLGLLSDFQIFSKHANLSKLISVLTVFGTPATMNIVIYLSHTKVKNSSPLTKAVSFRGGRGSPPPKYHFPL